MNHEYEIMYAHKQTHKHALVHLSFNAKYLYMGIQMSASFIKHAF